MMSEQTVTFDPHRGLAYIYLAGPIPNGGVKKTLLASPDINLDFDAEGHLIGIELLRDSLLHPNLKADAIPPDRNRL